MNAQTFAGKICVVTGAASGIGRAVAEMFCEEGALVVGVDLNDEALEEVARRANGGNGSMVTKRVDLTDAAAVEAFSQWFLSEYDSLHCLFNNAGMPGPRGIRIAEPAWQSVVALNLTAGIALTGQLIERLKAQDGGNVVFNASVSGLVASPNSPGYSAVKAGTIGYTRAAAVALGSDGVRVNAVCPTLTETPMLERFFDDPETDGDSEAIRARIADYVHSVPLGRLATVNDVAQAVLFLASDRARFVTGVALPVDGGYSAK